MYAPPETAAAPRAQSGMMRHDLAWLSAAGWDAARAQAQPEHRSALVFWRRNGWPAVVRRRDADAGADEVCLGIPLPPDPATGRKIRIPLRLHHGHIARCTAPLPLQPPLPPHAASAASAAIIAAAAASKLSLRIYGSYAMQALTGLCYVTPASDIDLLFYPTSVPQLEAGLALLATHAERLPLDGEIIFPDGSAVSWKEWLQAGASRSMVLVKDSHAVRLQQPAVLLAMLERQP
jgi:phosphoribosyl-dephospho-CoA transferase